MEGVLALMIPIVAVGGFFAWMISLSPIGKAYAERLRGRKGSSGDAEGQEELLESVEQLRREVAELAERVDFTERLLGQQRGSERLGPPRP
jgi:aldehyde:ferredoxin oxidoreductase